MTAAAPTAATRKDRRTTHADGPQLLRIWLSPSFPVGAFAYSHGLESAVARGLVSNASDLAGWIAALIARGSLRNDLILLGEAWRLAAEGSFHGLAELNATATALQPSAERYLEATQQGGSFVATIAAAWPCEAVEQLRNLDKPIAYPVAVGAAAAGHAISLSQALSAYALAFAMNLVSAAIRLSVIGQTDGQRVIARMLPLLRAQSTEAEKSSLDDLGSATISSDLASLEHETLYSRLFRS